MSFIYSSLKNLRDRARASVTIKTSNFVFFLALFLVVCLAIFIRLSPLSLGNYLIKAFDPWIQYYNAEYLSTHSIFEYFNWHDFKSWFPEGYNRGNLRPGLTFTVVTIYQIVNSLGIPISLYDICYFFPAIMGGMSVYAIYLVGKETLDRRCGLIAAFFLAFNPGFMQRTTAGFFDNETIGVFAALMTFYFFIKTVRTGKFYHAILGGIFSGYLALSWGGFNFVLLIFPIVCGIMILMKKYDSNILIAYAGIEGVGILIYSFSIKFPYHSFFTSIELGAVFYFTIFLVIFHILYTNRNNYSRLYDGIINTIKWGIIPVVAIFGVIIWVAPNIIPFGFGQRLVSVLSPLVRDSLNIVASVAEHMPSSWSVFYYNTLIPLTLLPLGLFFLFKRGNVADILLLTFLILIFYFTGSMIRIILLFAPAACLVGAYGLINVLKIFGSFYGEKRMGISRKRKRQVKRMIGKSEIGAVYFIVGIMCIAQVMHASNIALTQLSQSQLAPGGEIHDWEETLTWMKTNLPGTSVVVSWWDYGYWITPIGNMTSVNDNGTVNQTRIGLTGMAMMQTNEIYSAKAFNALKADYVLVYFGMLYSGLGGDEGKWPWMVRICNDNYQKYKNFGMEEDNWASNSVFVESEYFNATTGQPTAKWFESQLVRLMFYGLPTSAPPDLNNLRTFTEYYQDQITRALRDDQGNLYVTHIPDNGDYQFKVFKPEYISTNGMVKLFKLDYTALESSFLIQNPEVFDTGYASFKLKNTGSKELTISDVKINGESYNFNMGKAFETNTLNATEDDLVWVDIKSSGNSFEKNDIVNIEVEAQSIAIDSSPFTFTNHTSNLFVQEAKEGEIKINKISSIVVQVDDSTSEINLEIENTGLTTVILKDFYIDNETNTLNNTMYVSGSPILEPGQKSLVKITNTLYQFDPIRTEHKIGVITPNGIKDEVLFTSNYDPFKISILEESRITSPEAKITTQTNFRKHIPINLEKTYAYTYDNGTTHVKIMVKNTGDIILGLDSIYLTSSSSWTSILDFIPFNLIPGKERSLTITASDYLTGIEVNDEIGIIVTGNFDSITKASDIGFVHTIVDKPDIKIIDVVEGHTASFIAANETGKILIKNTGDEAITLDKLYLNSSTSLSFTSDVNFDYGDISLDMQECALVSFNINGFKLNSSNILNVNITTNTSAQYNMNFSVFVDSNLYKINIDDTGTFASITGNLVIKIDNEGLFNLTVDSVYINNTLISFSNFVEDIYEIGVGSSIQFTIIDIIDLLNSIFGSVDDGEILSIIVRTKEGAEDIHDEIIGS